jgi:pilus assembly protein CpaF
MIRVTIIRQGAEDESEVQEFTRGPISIGRAGQNDIVLANSRVSGTHARVIESESGITLVDNNSTNGTFVNGTLARGPVVVEPADAIEIGAFTLHFETILDDEAAGEEVVGDDLVEEAEEAEEVDPYAEEVHASEFEDMTGEPQELEEPPDLLGGHDAPHLDAGGTDLRQMGMPPGDALPQPPLRDGGERSAPVYAPRGAPEFVEPGPAPGTTRSPPPGYASEPQQRATVPEFTARPYGPEFSDLPRIAHAAPTTGLRGAFDRTVQRLAGDPGATTNTEAVALQFARTAVDQCCPELDARQRRQWSEWIAREVSGLGPLTDLLAEEAVSEIFIHGADRIEVRRDGARVRHPTRFSCDRALELALHRMIGRAPDERHPTIDGVTPAGVTVHAVGKPLVHGGPIVLISPPQPGPAGLADFVAQGRVTGDAADLLNAAVTRGENLLVCAAPGLDSGAWVAALAAAAPDDQRIIVVHRGTVARTLMAQAIVLDGSRDMTAAVRSALRVRPDCLVVLDLGGREVADLCEAARRMTGSLIASVAAASPEGALARLQALASLAMTADPAAVAAYVTGCFDLVLGLRASPSVGALASSLVEIRHAHGGELVERLEADE